jgi:hypothetical protein
LETIIKVLTPADLHKITGLSLRFIYKKLGDGTIPNKKIGDRYFLTEKMLAAFLEGKNQPPTGGSNL